ncbi:hypothetical protein ABT121_12955 [Streptomyces sp. NPDC001928]|uniref:hypothetical protein n=1 Tax=Streptomyces sp. NPDC001928 TaxID=3154404 RepID=UPI0033243027
MNRHLRKAAVATAAITAGLLMTACQSGTDTGSADKSGTGGATAVAEKTPDSKNSETSESSKNSEGSKDVNGSSSAAQQDTGSDSDSGETVVEGINKGKGVNGTWFGNVSYLAPGKYTVSDMKGVEQQFLLAEDTKIWGYGDICGDANTGEGGQGGTECTEAELESAAKKGFSAEVVISNGIATTVRDDH